ncbi:MAG: 3-methyl-2-oxobutanoate hydroxymethyltransferase [Gemmatimonadota bacterium]|nr:MAG: 3-methyl-2-oxobutanoate hydroxymethyltransferase [Gemmatimonadota bacterium]
MTETRVTTSTLMDMKREGEKIAVLTAYDFLTARFLDEAGIDMIIVGDSVSMVFAGHETTLPVTMDEMLYHTKAVSRGCRRPLIIGDMPFLSYQTCVEDAIRNSGRFLQEGGAQAVKLEGGTEMADTISRVVERGIPVMGHIGLTPQSIHKFGGYKVQGNTEDSAQYLLSSAKILEQAGVFSMVLEKIPAHLAREITQAVSVPTIGIGAGVHCDGQVLVTQDMLGIFDLFQPKFVRRYADLAESMKAAFQEYIKDVKGGAYPSEEESY